VYVADYVDRHTFECVDRTLDMMMFGIDEGVARLFNKDAARFPLDSDVTRAARIDQLLPGSSIQEHVFEPCGYSMNGLLRDAYWTIHITPESHCSYASFETNLRMRDYSALVRAVLAIFKPLRFTMTLFADEHGIKLMNRMPFDPLVIVPQPLIAPSLPPAADAAAVAAATAAAAAAYEVDAEGNTAYPLAAAATAGGAAAAPTEPLHVSAPTALNYLQSLKGGSEFLGYSSHMANYTLVTDAEAAAKLATRRAR